MTDKAIAACGGDARQAVTALIVANEFLEVQVRELQAAVSNGYAYAEECASSLASQSFALEPAPQLRPRTPN